MARRRSPGEGFVRFTLSVAPETQLMAKKMAAEVGVSMSLLVDQMMRDEQRTHQSRDTLRAENDAPKREELPLTG